MSLRPFAIGVLVVVLSSGVAAGQGAALSVTPISASCGAAGGTGETSVRTTAAGPSITVTLERFSSYCTPAPGFDATLRADGTIVLTAREPAPPVARCVCPYTVQLRVDGVPVGTHAIEVRVRDQIRARGTLTRAADPAPRPPPLVSS